MGWAGADRTLAWSSDTGTAPRHWAAFGTGAVLLRRGCATAAARTAGMAHLYKPRLSDVL